MDKVDRKGDKYCNVCHRWKNFASFRYESKPPNLPKKLAPRKLLGRICNYCREAWIMKNERRIVNAQSMGEIDWLKAELGLKALQKAKADSIAKRNAESSERMHEYHRNRKAVLNGQRKVWTHVKPEGAVRELDLLQHHKEMEIARRGLQPNGLDETGFMPTEMRSLNEKLAQQKLRVERNAPLLQARSQWSKDPEVERQRRAKIAEKMRQIWAERKAGSAPMPRDRIFND